MSVKDFGAVLRAYRVRRKFSQMRLAHAAGLHPTHINRLEYGDRRPRRGTVEAIADALDLTMEERLHLWHAAYEIPGGDPIVINVDAMLRELKAISPLKRQLFRDAIEDALGQAR